MPPKNSKTKHPNNEAVFPEEDCKPPARPRRQAALKSEERSAEVMKAEDDNSTKKRSGRRKKEGALKSEEPTAEPSPSKPTMAAVVRTRKKYGDLANLNKEAFYKEFHDAKTIVDVCRIIVSETTSQTREKLGGKKNKSIAKATAHVIGAENLRRQGINSQSGHQRLQLIDTRNLQNYDTNKLKEMMCQLPALPSPLPQNFSRVDYVLAHLDTLKTTDCYAEWATAAEKVIDQHYDPVNNILFVPMRRTANLTAEQKEIRGFADACSRFWDDEKHATSRGKMNAGKKEVLSFLGFITDRTRHRYAKNVAELRDFKLIHGHCHPTRSQHPTLYDFLWAIRSGSTDLPADIENELNEIGWRKEQNPGEERARVTAVEYDREMVGRCEKFHKRNGHCFPPFPDRTGEQEIKPLFGWMTSVRQRLKEDANQLDKGVLDRLVQLGFLTEVTKHYGPYRSEHRHFELVDQWWKKLGFFPLGAVQWNANDQVLVALDKRKRRPDRVLIGIFGDAMRMIIVEFDEAGHFDRCRESEQKKVYYQCTHFLADKENNVRDIHIIRINGGYSPFPCEQQAKQHAVMLDVIMNLPFPDKPCVTVHMLDFDEEHIHVKAYQARIIPKCGKYARAEKEDQWDSLPLYDQVKLYWSPKARSNAGD